MTAIILMYTWFVGDGSNGCHLHKFAVSITLVLFLLYLILSVKVEHGALLPTMVVFAYTASLCWSALQSSPDLATCDTRAASNRGSAWDTAQLVIGAIFVAASLCYSSLSAGSSRSSFALSVKPDTSGGRAEQVEEELAAFAFSHIMMTLASIYMSMLLTGWQIVGTSSALNVDQGAGSFWVKLCSEWATCLMYMWSLAAPLIFKDRDFGLGNSAWWQFYTLYISKNFLPLLYCFTFVPRLLSPTTTFLLHTWVSCVDVCFCCFFQAMAMYPSISARISSNSSSENRFKWGINVLASSVALGYKLTKEAIWKVSNPFALRLDVSALMDSWFLSWLKRLVYSRVLSNIDAPKELDPPSSDASLISFLRKSMSWTSAFVKHLHLPSLSLNSVSLKELVERRNNERKMWEIMFTNRQMKALLLVYEGWINSSCMYMGSLGTHRVCIQHNDAQ